MCSITELTELYGFVKYSDVEVIDNQLILPKLTNRLNVLYAIAVNGEVMYIGQTVNLRKRINYYRTSINRQTPTADTRKSRQIHAEIEKGNQVTFYFRQCFELQVHNPTGKDTVSTADIEEPALINRFKPVWNTVYKNKHKPKRYVVSEVAN